MNAGAQRIIAALDLAPLPVEGVFFRRTWRNETGSAIYFLLTADDFSAFHRLRSDEIWHFYAGDSVEHVSLVPGTGAAQVVRLGGNVPAAEVPQLIVPAGVWQAARLAPDDLRDPATPPRAGWALLGCTMTPAWEEKDFELAARAALLRTFPAAAAHVRALTR